MTSNLYIIAGPNGAGKTTFAKQFLPNYADGYRIHIFFLWIQSVDIALARIADRVRRGGTRCRRECGSSAVYEKHF
jgi:predicted ABC-type ATPase